MAENENMILENGAEEAAEDKMETAAESTPAQPDYDDRENAPRSEAAEEEPVKPKKKRRRSYGMPVLAVLFLLMFALIFGVVLGYMVGRNTMSQQLAEKDAYIDELILALEEAGSREDDVPDDDLTVENEAALAELAGEGFTMGADEVSPLVGEDNLFTGESAQADAAEAVIVAEFNGGTLMSDEVRREYSNQITAYAFAGYTEEEIASELLGEILNSMVSDKVLQLQARQLGLYDLTSADLDQIETEAQKQYQEQLSFARPFVRSEGMSEADVAAAAQAYLAETEGVTLESVRAELQEGWWLQKLYQHVVRGVQVSPSDIVALYNEKLNRQRENFEAYPEEFEYAQLNGETMAYNLPGYRAVKLLMIGFGSGDTLDRVYDLTEEIAALDPTADAARIAELEGELDACYAASEAKAQEVLDRMAAGASFDSMLDQYGEDEGMRNSSLRKTGYYVSENSVVWAPAIVEETMALQNAGDLSGVIRLDDGVCILQYLGEVTPGAVPQAAIYEEISAETLEIAQYDAYNAQVEAWLQAAAPTFYPERLR